MAEILSWFSLILLAALVVLYGQRLLSVIRTSPPELEKELSNKLSVGGIRILGTYKYWLLGEYRATGDQRIIEAGNKYRFVTILFLLLFAALGGYAILGTYTSGLRTPGALP